MVHGAIGGRGGILASLLSRQVIPDELG